MVIIFRYLAKEVFTTLAGLTTILLLIFMSNQFIHYLSRAASGQLPAMLIMKLMMLELPNLMGLLLPLGFFVSILVAYGRLYADSEMIVLQACGYGPQQLLKHSLSMAMVVASLILYIMLFVSPHIASERARLLRTTGVQTLIQTIVPGRFRDIPGGRGIFYVEEMNTDHTVAKNVFFAHQNNKSGKLMWDVMWADKAFAKTDPKTHEDYVIFEVGKGYEGVPGKADYQVAEFQEYAARLPHPTVSIKADLRTASTRSLLPYIFSDPNKAAEFQWRLSVPLMVLTLTLAAVPLSRVNPRAGKYAKLLPALALFMIYANFMFVARNWVAHGNIPIWLGMWWMHALVALLGGYLIWRNRVHWS